MPEAFAFVQVRQMNFYEAQRNRSQCVAQRDAGMGECASINNDEIGAVGARQLDAVDYRTLMIGLKKHDLRIFLLCGGAKFALR